MVQPDSEGQRVCRLREGLLRGRTGLLVSRYESIRGLTRAQANKKPISGRQFQLRRKINPGNCPASRSEANCFSSLNLFKVCK